MTHCFDDQQHKDDDDGPSAFFGPLDDLMRYLDVLRLLAWLVRLLRELFAKRKERPEPPKTWVAPSLSRNEFGYVDMRGAF